MPDQAIIFADDPIFSHRHDGTKFNVLCYHGDVVVLYL